ncbi:MAG: Hsp20/alpha crystallin family protein [Verrucomicrobiota bacterium]
MWSDIDSLQREMDRLFSEVSGGPAVREFPAVNLYSSDDDLVLTAELPGIDPDKLDISVKDDTVTVRGERTTEEPGENERILRQERGSGSFVRSFTLPFRIDADKVNAEYKRGILMVKMPKAEEDKSRKISVSAA